ncbi:MAG: hypothetical protein Q8O89_01575, partial [Nanoarchaeota archaeon]|nr:hypothetical protein [Nanoarchaeota archaeon]
NAFNNMNNQAQSFQSKARTALSNGDALTAYEFVQKAHAVIQDYERSPLFIEGKTSGIRGSLGKLESRILSCQ